MDNLPLSDGTDWEVPRPFYEQLVNTYARPALDCELSKMRLWLVANERRRKTARGIKRFVAGWLIKSGIPQRPKERAATCCDCQLTAVGKFERASYCDEHLRFHTELGR